MAKTIFPPPIKRWSFSALKDFEACPYRIYLKRVERAPEPEPDGSSETPLERGDRIHLAAERFVKGEAPMIKELSKFAQRLEKLREQYAEGLVEVEQKWGFGLEWEQREWSDKDCWALVKCDVVVHGSKNAAWVIDYKTGKSRNKEVPHRQQLQLYGLATLLRYPQIEIANTSLWYTDEGKETKASYSRAQIAPLLSRWEQRAKRLTEATTFPPKANKGNCKYCSYGVFVGTGVCPYAVEG